jgi:hypothetical protein
MTEQQQSTKTIIILDMTKQNASNTTQNFDSTTTTTNNGNISQTTRDIKVMFIPNERYQSLLLKYNFSMIFRHIKIDLNRA